MKRRLSLQRVCQNIDATLDYTPMCPSKLSVAQQLEQLTFIQANIHHLRNLDRVYLQLQTYSEACHDDVMTLVRSSTDSVLTL